MNDATTNKDIHLEDGANGSSVRYYKKDFWGEENLKFSQPHYRLEKSARLVNKLARGKECSLLDVGCGPAALMRLLSPNIRYHGIDIAIHEPAPHLRESDIVENPIRFDDERFDIIIAQGVFEYVGKVQSQKFVEIARILNRDGKFIVSYWNFDHRNKQVYWPFSNIQPIDDFQESLSRHFAVDRFFPASHNWKQGSPNRKLNRVINMHMNANLPFISPLLAVEYFFICSLRGQGGPNAQG